MDFKLPFENVAADDPRREVKLAANDAAIRDTVPEAHDDDSALCAAIAQMPTKTLLVMFLALEGDAEPQDIRDYVREVLVDHVGINLEDLTDYAYGRPQN